MWKVINAERPIATCQWTATVTGKGYDKKCITTYDKISAETARKNAFSGKTEILSFPAKLSKFPLIWTALALLETWKGSSLILPQSLLPKYSQPGPQLYKKE